MKALEYVASISEDIVDMKEIPQVIVATGNVTAWKKGIAEWQEAMEEIQKVTEATVSRCEAFLEATDTVAVAIYELVRVEYPKC